MRQILIVPLLVVLMAIGIWAVGSSTAGAQTPGLTPCPESLLLAVCPTGGGDTDGNVWAEVPGTVVGADGAPVPVVPDSGGGPNGSDRTVGLPVCRLVGNVVQNGPCYLVAPRLPCDNVPVDETATATVAEPCGGPAPVAAPAVPPVIPPPSIAVAGDRALNAMVWPTISPGPDLSFRSADTILLGYEHSLELVGYQDWSTLTATAPIVRTVTQDGIVYSETFTSTLTATPVEVRWDTGRSNTLVSRHDPPIELVCDNPGKPNWVGDTGEGPFQDWQTYSGYGGHACAYVFWGMSAWMDGDPTVITAEVVWDLVLDMSWAGTENIGEHIEDYTSEGYLVTAVQVVGVNRGAETSSSIVWSWDDDEDD